LFKHLIEITNISPNSGSTQGQTTVQIKGKYLYHSSVIPANIIVSGLFFIINKTDFSLKRTFSFNFQDHRVLLLISTTQINLVLS
jgi:hypothetical protein